MTSFLEQPLGQFLERLAAPVPAPGGGGTAALAGALAAGLVAMAARYSARQMPDAGEVAGAGDLLRQRATELMDEDADAYQAVLDAFRPTAGDGGGRNPDTVHSALQRAAMAPLEIAEVAVKAAELAVRVAAEGNPNLRGDAVAAVLLAEASARSAAFLVDINVTAGGLDPGLSARAARSVSAARALSDRVAGAEAGPR